jgi:hypothetical protein
VTNARLLAEKNFFLKIKVHWEGDAVVSQIPVSVSEDMAV